MGEIAIFIFDHLGVAAIVLLLGVLADYYSSQSLKQAIGRWLKSTDSFDFSRPKVRSVLRYFLDGFIHRIYGEKQFSFKFFIRSSLVTLLFLGVAVLFQSRNYDGFLHQLTVTSESIPVSLLVLFVLLIVNFVIDYISNVQTISLLNMAASSGRIFDLFVVCVADIALTVTLFTLIFPMGICLGIIAFEAFRPPTVLMVSVSESVREFESYRKRVGEFVGEDQSLKYKIVQLRLSNSSLYAPVQSLTQPIIYRAIDEAESLKIFAETYRGYSRTIRFEGRNEKEGLIDLQFGALPMSLHFLERLYGSSFVGVNVTRDGFLHVVALRPITISIGDIYDKTRDDFYMKNLWFVRCDSGEMKLASSDVKAFSECKPVAARIANDGPEGIFSERAVVAGAAHLPISPFFFTSFTSSILFYVALLVVGFGILAFRLLGRVFSTEYFETANKPFAILSLFVFVFVEVVVVVFRLIV